MAHKVHQKGLFVAEGQRSPDFYRQKTRAALSAGKLAEARGWVEEGLLAFPTDAALFNSAGNSFLQMQDAALAAECFGKAAKLSPGFNEYPINQAIALSAANKHTEAIAVLKTIEKAEAKTARYCSARAVAERGASNLANASDWYDRALAIEPRRPKALYGRAWVALERSEEDALERIDLALSVNHGEADLWLGKAQALDSLGEKQEARAIAEEIVRQAPGWLDGLRLLAQLRLDCGEKDFDSHFHMAMERAPHDPNIPICWTMVLSGLDRNLEASEVSARAAKLFPEIDHFTFLQGLYLSASGAFSEAEAIFRTVDTSTPDRWLHMAKHMIRRGDFGEAEALLQNVILQDGCSIPAWAMRDIVWRKIGDPRVDWLHGQHGLVALRELVDAEKVLPAAIARLHSLHDKSPMPIGQSLRGGTQTRGILFNRKEPEFAALRNAILATLEIHRQALPPTDPAHPLLRHREEPWRISGSWSVRLNGGPEGGGDFHASHIHPEGVVSSALYLELPKIMAKNKAMGALELGRPPRDMFCDLEPFTVLKPKEAHLALFPSTLYHGTSTFAHGALDEKRRMTVAFDLTPSAPH